MRNIFVFILILGSLNFSVGQNSNIELLKNYEICIEKNIEIGKWSTKFYLSNGLVSIQENYWKNELRSRTEFEHDQYENIKIETQTYDINEGKVNYVSNLKLKYKDTLLIRKEFSFGMTEKYSDFNSLGKPQLIERTDESVFKAFPFKELIEYDKNGNITKSTEFSVYEELNGKTIHQKATTHFKYDIWNNVIEIHREFEPEQEFPIIMIGGPAKHEYEYFRYKYNKIGLWTKKFKTVNGKENLVAKRKYK